MWVAGQGGFVNPKSFNVLGSREVGTKREKGAKDWRGGVEHRVKRCSWDPPCQREPLPSMAEVRQGPGAGVHLDRETTGAGKEKKEGGPGVSRTHCAFVWL